VTWALGRLRFGLRVVAMPVDREMRKQV
jgi:hypothetical protein